MKLVILVVALAVQARLPPGPSQPVAREKQQPSITLPSSPAADEHFSMPNVFNSGPGCRPIVQQVQEEALRNRGDDHRTLDREPPASLLFVVDRHVGGCREPTFVRRNIRSSEQPAPPR